MISTGGRIDPADEIYLYFYPLVYLRLCVRVTIEDLRGLFSPRVTAHAQRALSLCLCRRCVARRIYN